MNPTGPEARDNDQRPSPIWRPIADLEGIWQAERETMRVPLRAVALRLADGRLGIYSPIHGLGSEAHRALTDVGRPTILIAPNHFHNLGLREYASTYPGVSVVASGAAVPRLKQKCGLDVRDESRLREALPGDVTILVPPETRNGELWLSVGTSVGRAWIVGDGFFNIVRTPRTPMGLLLFALGIAPGLRIGSTFMWMIRERAAYRSWLIDTIANEAPTILLPCHGTILRDPNLPDRLRRLAEARL